MLRGTWVKLEIYGKKVNYTHTYTHIFIIMDDCELYVMGLKMTACPTMLLSHWRHSHLCEDFQKNQDEEGQARDCSDACW